jgi:deoxycytidine triphosphate deaminase
MESTVSQTSPEPVPTGQGAPTEPEKKPRLEKDEWKFCDPEKETDRKGMLLSDQIDKFCKKGLLIAANYDESRLRPAAYTLTIGTDYVDSSGRTGRFTKDRPHLEMKPNSIIYVTTAEELDLPHYIAARFNLRVKWVYKGILLGTGPQVEPGYRGFLSCPLYNFTNRPLRIRQGDEFATIDFERTTNFCSGKARAEIEPNIRTGEKLDEVTVEGKKYLLFKNKKYKPLQHLPDYDVVSSLVGMQKEVRTWRYIGIGTVVAFVSLALSIIGLQVRMEGTVIGTARDVSKLQAELQQTKEKVDSAQNTTRSLPESTLKHESATNPPSSPEASGKPRQH